ncbi:MAG TPA: hypothetical protein VGX03_32095 [Candidatus Binatia bacterium]|jgi:hypothetical protein|nr:hypothetical protein [Candidatus Binatia bacterium]
MKHSERWLIAGLMIAGLPLTGCQRTASTHKVESPAVVEHVQGSKLNRVTLTERAIERIALKTDQVREQRVLRSSSPRKVVPYSSLIYDTHGETWVYISPQPRTFIRHEVEVDYIEGDIAVLKDGPPVGTVVASVGVAELYGTDFGVGH